MPETARSRREHELRDDERAANHARATAPPPIAPSSRPHTLSPAAQN